MLQVLASALANSSLLAARLKFPRRLQPPILAKMRYVAAHRTCESAKAERREVSYSLSTYTLSCNCVFCVGRRRSRIFGLGRPVELRRTSSGGNICIRATCRPSSSLGSSASRVHAAACNPICLNGWRIVVIPGVDTADGSTSSNPTTEH